MAPRPSVQDDDRRKPPTVPKTRIQDVLSDAKRTNFDDQEQVEQFQRKHSAQLDSSGSNPKIPQRRRRGDVERGNNVLHALIIDTLGAEGNLDGYTPFVRWAIRFRPKLLDREGDDEMTPLHLAIKRGNLEFVQQVLDGSKNVRKLLEQSANGHNCLHLAVLQRNPLTCRMIGLCRAPFVDGTNGDRASRDVLPATDIFLIGSDNKHYRGMTPLHMAIFDFQGGIEDECQCVCQCSTRSASVVQAAPVKDSRRTIKDKEAKGVSTPKVASNGENDFLKKGPGEPGVDDGVIANIKISRRPTIDFAEDAGAQREDGKEGERPSRKLGKFDDLHIIHKLIEANPDVLVNNHDDNEDTPFRARLNELLPDPSNNIIAQESVESGIDRDRVIENDPILTYLRQYIIDNFDRRNAKKALYSVSEERALEFDLSGLPYSTITPRFLHDLGKILRFEKVLKYVALPRLAIEGNTGIESVETNEDGPKATTGPAMKGEFAGHGLTHMVQIFQWLKREGVKSVLKVIVIDDVEPSHSDESIEECLKGMDVRVWNWYKIDLCSDVIVKSSPNARDVTLYSSGNNAVLKGWSSASGLAKLRKLRRVHVFVKEGLDSDKRLKGYMESFEKDLKRNRGSQPDEATVSVTWTPLKPHENYNSIFAERPERTTESQWMRTMEDFAILLRSAESHNRRAKRHVEPVRIAIIDDGINTNLGTFADRIEAGESFYQLSEISRHWVPFYVPSGPHGTQMAKLICEVCPVAKLYIAQLEVLRGQNGRRSFNHASAAEAIEWAIKQDVDIISMSWSISGNEHLATLEKALRDAADNNIIMFCAAIDEGATTKDNTYPGKVGTCIKIGASTSMGAKLSWVSGKSSQFLFPGDVLLSGSGDDPVTNPYAHSGASGSSVSTALAAGLAGALLYCDRLIQTPKSRVTLESKTLVPGTTYREVDFLRTTGAMHTALTSLSAPIDQSNFVQLGEHWNRLRGNMTAENLAWNSDTEEKLRTFIANLKG